MYSSTSWQLAQANFQLMKNIDFSLGFKLDAKACQKNSSNSVLVLMHESAAQAPIATNPVEYLFCSHYY